MKNPNFGFIPWSWRLGGLKLSWQPESVLFNWPGLMRQFPAIAALAFLPVIFPLMVSAQEQSTWDIQALNNIIPGGPIGSLTMQGDFRTGTITGTNGVYVKYGATVLTADTASVNKATGEVVADGHVRIETGDQIWVGDHITYNFNTHVMTERAVPHGQAAGVRGGPGIGGQHDQQNLQCPPRVRDDG